MYLAHISDLKKKILELTEKNHRLNMERTEEIERTREMFNTQAERDRFELTKLRGQSL